MTPYRKMPPQLFDLALRRLRSSSRRLSVDSFLHRIIAEETSERCNELGVTLAEASLLSDRPWPPGLYPAPMHELSLIDAWGRREHLARDPGPGGRSGPGCDPRPKSDPGIDGAIIAVMGLHWVNDLPGLLSRVRHALPARAPLIAGFIGGRSLHELREVLTEAEIVHTGGAAARVSPFVDLRDLAALAVRAGLTEPVANSVRLPATYLHLAALMHDLRAMGETNAMLESVRRPLRRDVLDTAQSLYATRFPAHDGRIHATFEVVYLVAWNA